jgi:hypothetical protein
VVVGGAALPDRRLRNPIGRRLRCLGVAKVDACGETAAIRAPGPRLWWRRLLLVSGARAWALAGVGLDACVARSRSDARARSVATERVYGWRRMERRGKRGSRRLKRLRERPEQTIRRGRTSQQLRITSASRHLAVNQREAFRFQTPVINVAGLRKCCGLRFGRGAICADGRLAT